MRFASFVLLLSFVSSVAAYANFDRYTIVYTYLQWPCNFHGLPNYRNEFTNIGQLPPKQNRWLLLPPIIAMKNADLRMRNLLHNDRRSLSDSILRRYRQRPPMPFQMPLINWTIIIAIWREVVYCWKQISRMSFCFTCLRSWELCGNGLRRHVDRWRRRFAQELG